jgi:hypothetical protein
VPQSSQGLINLQFISILGNVRGTRTKIGPGDRDPKKITASPALKESAAQCGTTNHVINDEKYDGAHSGDQDTVKIESSHPRMTENVKHPTSHDGADDA